MDILLVLINFILTGLEIFKFILLIRLIGSFFNPDFYGNRFWRIIYILTEWILELAGKYFYFLRFPPLDFSPIVIFLILELVRTLLRKLLVSLMF